MSARLRLLIVSPRGTLCDTPADSVSLPAEDGAVGILPNHCPLLAALSAGKVGYRDGEAQKTVEINGGIAEVRDNTVTVLCR